MRDCEERGIDAAAVEKRLPWGRPEAGHHRVNHRLCHDIEPATFWMAFEASDG